MYNTVLEQLANMPRVSSDEKWMEQYFKILTRAKIEESIESIPTLKTHGYEFTKPNNN